MSWQDNFQPLFTSFILFILFILSISCPMPTNQTDEAKKPDAEEQGRIEQKGAYDQGNTGRYDNQQYDADGGTPRAGEDLPMAGGGYGQGMNTEGYDQDPEAANAVKPATGAAFSADGKVLDAGNATESASDPNASTGSTAASGHGSGGRASGG